jgi:hypothetical protein
MRWKADYPAHANQVMSDTPRTDSIPRNGAFHHYRVEDVISLCGEMERALRNLMPFVLDEYYPDCAMPKFKAAVEAALSLTSEPPKESP